MNPVEEHERLINWIPDAHPRDLIAAVIALLREHHPLAGHVFHRDSRNCPAHRDERVAAKPDDRQTYLDCPTCITFFKDTCASRECMCCEGWPCPIVETIQEAIL